MSRAVRKLTLAEFLQMPESCDRTELVDGEIVPKVSPKYKHSTSQLQLLLGIHQWYESRKVGRVRPEWAVVLQRQGQDWVPVPDLTYVSYERLPIEWEEDAPCPPLPELVIEIISPGQSFGEMTQKATDYLLAGVSRVWVVDNQAPSVTVFGANKFLQTYWRDNIIADALLPGLEVAVADLFVGGNLPDANKSK